MTSTFEKLYNFIVNKEHHKYRHTVDFKLAEEYSAKGLSPIERMSDRFRRICEEEKAVILEGMGGNKSKALYSRAWLYV